jgi:hypothetical protein
MVCVWSEKKAGRGSVLESISHTIWSDGFHVHCAPLGGEDAEVVEGVTVTVLGDFREADDIRPEYEFIKVRIQNFISPTIIKRLDMGLSVFKARIIDWLSQVDCVMIDTAYDGKVFKVALSDVPAKRTDLVVGEYKPEHRRPQRPWPSKSSTCSAKKFWLS